MKAGEKASFVAMLNGTLSVYDKPQPTPAVVDLWWNLLADYDLPAVSRAFAAHMKDRTQGRFVPKPGDVIDKLQAETGGDGFPNADEAWAICPTGESQSVVWCDEIVQAWGIAEPIMDDRVAARMAFKGAYERLVEQARAEGRRPVWTASLGHDAHSRRDVIETAVRVGRLTSGHAKKLLPPPDVVPDLKLLESSATGNKEREETIRLWRSMLRRAA